MEVDRDRHRARWHVARTAQPDAGKEHIGQARGQEFRNGFFDQTVQLWNEAGTMLATSHQIVYYKE